MSKDKAAKTCPQPSDAFLEALKDEYGPYTFHDPPWLKGQLHEHGFHRHMMGGWEVLILPKVSVASHLRPALAFWFDMEPVAPWPGCPMMDLWDSQSEEVVKVVPPYLFVCSQNAHRCYHCGDANPPRKCTTFAWTGPDPGSGEYPRINALGEEERPISYGCWECRMSGRQCKFFGVWLEGPEFGRRATIDGQPVLAPDLEDIFALPPGYSFHGSPNTYKTRHFTVADVRAAVEANAKLSIPLPNLRRSSGGRTLRRPILFRPGGVHVSVASPTIGQIASKVITAGKRKAKGLETAKRESHAAKRRDPPSKKKSALSGGRADDNTPSVDTQAARTPARQPTTPSPRSAGASLSASSNDSGRCPGQITVQTDRWEEGEPGLASDGIWDDKHVDNRLTVPEDGTGHGLDIEGVVAASGDRQSRTDHALQDLEGNAQGSCDQSPTAGIGSEERAGIEHSSSPCWLDDVDRSSMPPGSESDDHPRASRLILASGEGEALEGSSVTLGDEMSLDSRNTRNDEGDAHIAGVASGAKSQANDGGSDSNSGEAATDACREIVAQSEASNDGRDRVGGDIDMDVASDLDFDRNLQPCERSTITDGVGSAAPDSDTTEEDIVLEQVRESAKSLSETSGATGPAAAQSSAVPAKSSNVVRDDNALRISAETARADAQAPQPRQVPTAGNPTVQTATEPRKSGRSTTPTGSPPRALTKLRRLRKPYARRSDGQAPPGSSSTPQLSRTMQPLPAGVAGSAPRLFDWRPPRHMPDRPAGQSPAAAQTRDASVQPQTRLAGASVGSTGAPVGNGFGPVTAGDVTMRQPAASSPSASSEHPRPSSAPLTTAVPTPRNNLRPPPTSLSLSHQLLGQIARTLASAQASTRPPAATTPAAGLPMRLATPSPTSLAPSSSIGSPASSTAAQVQLQVRVKELERLLADSEAECTDLKLECEATNEAMNKAIKGEIAARVEIKRVQTQNAALKRQLEAKDR